MGLEINYAFSEEGFTFLRLRKTGIRTLAMAAMIMHMRMPMTILNFVVRRILQTSEEYRNLISACVLCVAKVPLWKSPPTPCYMRCSVSR